jgi:hypothetical protein
MEYLPANPEKFYKIMELPMNVTTNCHRAFNWLYK